MPIEQVLPSITLSNEEKTVTQIKESSNLWKRLLLKKLEFLDGGKLHIEDSEGAVTVGKGRERNVSIKVSNISFYRKLVLGGSLAASESYMDGDWECDDLYTLFRLFGHYRPLVEGLDNGFAKIARPWLKIEEWMKLGNRKNAKRNIAAHYDLGNDLFSLFLDSTMTYSSGIYENSDTTLKQASVAKLDRMCRVLELKPSDHVIEIGSGWGSFAIHAVSNYGCRVTSITLSEEQKALADKRINELGLSDKIEIQLRDYRTLNEKYDKLVSIEMIEAVGPKFMGTYFKTCNDILKPGGLAAIQAITLPDHAHENHLKQVDFIQKYIFPGSKIPCVSVLLEEARESGQLVLSDLKDITLDYGKTMCEWRRNFVAHLPEVKSLGYDDHFIRMWDYYLNYCAAGFTERYLGTVQMLFRKSH